MPGDCSAISIGMVQTRRDVCAARSLAIAVQLVRKGVDYGSLIEGLKARNSALSADRAAEIATTAISFVQRTRILHSKENQHATARNHSKPSDQRPR